MVNVNQKVCLFNDLLWLTLQETSRGCIQKYPPYPKSVIHKCPPNSKIRAFVQLEHRGMKCTFVTASEKECVYAICLHQGIVFFTKCCSDCAVPGTQGMTKGFGHCHCISHTCKLNSVSAKKMGCHGIKNPQPKSLQAMEEVIETSNNRRLWRMWH